MVLNFAPISISTVGELNINERTQKVLEGVKVRRCEVLHPSSKIKQLVVRKLRTDRELNINERKCSKGC